MKRLALLFLCVITLNSCSVNDDGTTILTKFAEVSEYDLPEYFEKGKSYKVPMAFLLPDMCHQAVGLQLSRGAEFGDERRDIYVAGVVSFNAEQSKCTLEPEDDSDLVVETEFTISIDEEEPYTFYFWTGLDSTGENIFEIVEVPVGVPGEEIE